MSLPRFLVNELRSYLAARGLRGHDFLFPSECGGQLRQSNFYRRTFKPVVEATDGIPDAMRFHDLRHTCAAILIDQGAHPKAIQERLGHSSIEVTMDTYGHLYESAEDALADALDATQPPWQRRVRRTEDFGRSESRCQPGRPTPAGVAVGAASAPTVMSDRKDGDR